MLMDEKMDTGSILAQIKFPIEPEATAPREVCDLVIGRLAVWVGGLKDEHGGALTPRPARRK